MQEPDKLYYKISEVSEMLNIPAYTLRFWEKEIPQLKPHKKEGKTRRFYTADDITLLRQIKYMREDLNLPIELVISRLNNNKTDLERQQQLLHTLESIREELSEIKKQL